MTREDIQREILSLKGSNWLLELATGTGKSKLALGKIKELSDAEGEGRTPLIGKTLLIVVPRNVHKKNWEEEIKKWWPDCPLLLSFTTYVSFPKYKGDWDFVIFDECHHLSERCREALCDFSIRHSILLSATVNNGLKDELREVFDNLVVYRMGLRNVIDEGILPDPTVYLIPLTLRTDLPTESIWKNPKAKGKLIECNWADRWKFIKQKEFPVRVYCTQMQYYIDLESQIAYWKKRYMSTRNDIAKNKWLRLCADRLKWLSDKKVGFLYTLLDYLKEHRTLTFCNSIEQTEKLGEYCINSKNKESIENYTMFNEGSIDHITACNMLNESMNLVDCQVGIYANLNSSETIIKQRTGRLLRHPNPVIVVPYYKNTREEELVEKMLEDYNPELVKHITKIEEISI